MKDYQSVQDLIVKAALHDKVSTTISPEELLGYGDTLRITFSRGNEYTATHVYLDKDPEEAVLYSCKRTLYKLFCGPYEEIEVVKETN